MKKILSIIVIMLSLTILFGCDQEEELRQVNIQVVSDTGIEIALGGSDRTPNSYNWLTTITTSSFNKMISDLYPEGFSFHEVTSPDGTVFFKMGVSQMIEVQEGFLKIPIHFRSDSAQSIALSMFNLGSYGSPWTSDIDFIDSKNNQILAGDEMIVYLADALRFSLTSDLDTFVFEKPVSGTNTQLGDVTSYDTDHLRGSASYYYAKTQSIPMLMTSFDLPDMTELSAPVTILQLDQVDENVFGASYYGMIVLRVWYELLDLESYQITLSEQMELSLGFRGE
ncbi:MAG: hypothetical protein RBQ71_02675 [Acholeplasmataceae bacterium]|nr:hypothetical protein [Acholeplasmataceae bacterium]